jgi:hypothetical protein
MKIDDYSTDFMNNAANAVGEYIPEKDVTKTWDSTLNNTYDRRCTAGAATLLTPSERACAASHLKVWRAIAVLREKLYGKEHGVRGTVIGGTSFSGDITGSSSNSSSSGSNSGTGEQHSVGILGRSEAGKDLIEVAAEVFKMCRYGGGWCPIPYNSLSSSGSMTAKAAAIATGKRKHKQSGSNKFGDTGSSSGSSSGGISKVMRLDSEDDWYLIFEDDAVLPKICQSTRWRDFQTILFDTLNKDLPPDWEICYLGHQIPKGAKKVYFTNVVKPDYLWMLHAYVLKGRAVGKILGSLPINRPVDNFLAELIHDGFLQVRLNWGYTACSLH